MDSTRLKRVYFLVLVLIFFLSSIRLAGAGEQESYREEQRRQRLERETEKKILKGKWKVLIDWGSSLEYSYERILGRRGLMQPILQESHVSICDIP